MDISFSLLIQTEVFIMEGKKTLRVLFLVIAGLILGTGAVSASGVGQKTVTLVVNGEKQEVETNALTFKDLLYNCDIEVGENDELSHPLDSVLNSENVYEINQAKPVCVTLDGVPKIIYTTTDTVGEFWEEESSQFDGKFYLSDISEDTEISDYMEIKLSSIQVVTTTTTELIDYERVLKSNPDLLIGTEEIIQYGEAGEAEVTVTQYIKEGEVIDEEVTRVVVKEPVKEIVECGTESIDVSTLSYSQKVSMRITAYTPYDEGCNGITATGTEAKRGVIAVDPSVIPFGTKVYIPGYGIGVAEDTGGAIKGNRIDVCYLTKTEAYNWGVRNVEVYILN